MSSRTLNRKDFLALTGFSVVASALAACGGDDPVTPIGGSAGTGGSGTAGTGGSGAGTTSTGGSASGGPGASGSPGTSGSGTGGSGTSGSGGMSGSGTGGSGGTAGSGGSGGASGAAGTGGAGGGGGGGKCGADIMVTSSSSGHTHTLLVTAAQITAGTDVTILSGRASNDMAAGHQHYVKITMADFTMLKAGMEVKKKSCAGGDHEYVLKCGGGASTPAAPTCTDDCGDGMNMGKACP